MRTMAAVTERNAICARVARVEADDQAQWGRMTAPEMICHLAADTRQLATHPYFGNLTKWEWMRWAYLHADHHLRQFGR